MEDFEEFRLIYEFLNPTKDFDKLHSEETFYNYYKDDWNAIMPAIRRIMAINNSCLRIRSHSCIIHIKKTKPSNLGIAKIFRYSKHTQKGAFYMTILAFIEWYNKMKSNEIKKKYNER